MIWLLALLVCGFLAYLLWRSSERPAPPPVDPEAAMRVAVKLHAIRRRLDADWTKTEQRRDASRLRRQIAKALDEADDLP